MKKLIFLIFAVLFSTTVHAAGETNVSVTNFAPSFVNSNQSFSVMNITFLAGRGQVNITSINITFLNINISNISSVSVFNSSSETLLLGSNSTFEVNRTKILLGSFIVEDTARRNITIVINSSSRVTPGSTFFINITASDEIGTNDSLNVINATVNTHSSSIQLQDVHANATMMPRFVDTNVNNQTFKINISVAGLNPFHNITIDFPDGYSFVSFVSVSNTSGIIYNGTQTTPLNVTVSTKRIFINSRNFTSSDGVIGIIFTANTNTSNIVINQVNVTLGGSNITNATAYIPFTNAMSITTQQLINITSVSIVKRTAIVNDTDYWEFNFTFLFTANTSGVLQFNTSVWNNGAGNILNLTNSSSGDIRYYASLRNETSSDTTNKFNITTSYGNSTNGLVLPDSTASRFLLFRMIIPSGTPVSSSWQSIYSIILRSGI